jgi:LacI family transcriptional regulator
MPYVHLAFYTQMLQHLHQSIKPFDYEMIISGLQMGEDDEPAPMRISRWPVDGVLAMDAGPWLRAGLEPKEWKDAATVSIGAFYSEEMDHVGVDFAPAAREAVLRLVASGRRRVAHLKMHWRGTGPQVRLDAYLDVLREAGLPSELILTSDHSRAGVRHAVTEYVREHGPPDGIFCHNDDFAIGAYRALRDMGLRIPDDVALVGCDNLEETAYLDVPLSTIAVPTEELCRTGWEFLYRRMHDPSAPLQCAILQPQLVVRASLGDPSPVKEVPATRLQAASRVRERG